MTTTVTKKLDLDALRAEAHRREKRTTIEVTGDKEIALVAKFASALDAMPELDAKMQNMFAVYFQENGSSCDNASVIFCMSFSCTKISFDLVYYQSPEFSLALPTAASMLIIDHTNGQDELVACSRALFKAVLDRYALVVDHRNRRNEPYYHMYPCMWFRYYSGMDVGRTVCTIRLK